MTQRPGCWLQFGLLTVFLAVGCGEPPIKGVALGLFDTSLSKAAIVAELQAIKRLGANSVSLPVYWYQRSVTSHEIQPYAADGLHPDSYDHLIRTAIRAAHGMGLRVLLLPVVQLEQVSPGAWRGALAPGNWDTWFDNYERFLLHYVRLAEEQDVALFSVGSELSSSESHVERWRQLISQVRGMYHGQLTYSANWDHYRQVEFWDDLDYLGMSGYYEITTEAPVTAVALRRGWQRIREDLEAWQQARGKPLLFTEIGYPSTSTAAHTPWNYKTGSLDLRQQQLCYRAFIDTWKGSPSLAGTYLWIWEPGRGGPADRGYAWRGKPVEADIAAWYRGD